MNNFKEEIIFNLGIFFVIILLILFIKILRIDFINVYSLVFSKITIIGFIIAYLTYIITNYKKNLFYYIITISITVGLITSLIKYFIF